MPKNTEEKYQFKNYWTDLKTELEKFDSDSDNQTSLSKKATTKEEEEKDQKDYENQRAVLEKMHDLGMQIEEANAWNQYKLGNQLNDLPGKTFDPEFASKLEKKKQKIEVKIEEIPTISGPKSYALAKQVYLPHIKRFQQVYFPGWLITAAWFIKIDIKARQEKALAQATDLEKRITEYETKQKQAVSMQPHDENNNSINTQPSDHSQTEPEATLEELQTQRAALEKEIEQLKIIQKEQINTHQILNNFQSNFNENLQKEKTLGDIIKKINTENSYQTAEEAIEKLPFTETTKQVLSDHEKKRDGNFSYYLTYRPYQALKQALEKNELPRIKTLEQQIKNTSEQISLKEETLTKIDKTIKAMQPVDGIAKELKKDLIDYLNAALTTNPGKKFSVSDKYKELDTIRNELTNPEKSSQSTDITCLIKKMSEIQEIAAKHRDTGFKGVIKCTWARKTCSEKLFYKFFSEHSEPEQPEVKNKPVESKNFIYRLARFI